MPKFAALYAAVFGLPRLPAMEERLMMRPHFCRIMIGHDALAEEEGAGELDVEHLAPDVLVQVGQRHAVVAARVGGIVHEHVEAPEGRHDGLHEAPTASLLLTSPVQVSARRPCPRIC